MARSFVLKEKVDSIFIMNKLNIAIPEFSPEWLLIYEEPFG